MSLSVSEQESLLKKCVDQELDLDEELSKLGLSYDDLVYRKSSLNEGALLLDTGEVDIRRIEDNVVKKTLSLCQFFSGCGGLDIGLNMAGFKSIISIRKKILCSVKKTQKKRVSDHPRGAGKHW